MRKKAMICVFSRAVSSRFWLRCKGALVVLSMSGSRVVPANCTCSVVVEHGLQGGQATVVHVGGRQGDVAQRRHPELAPVGGPAGLAAKAQVDEGCVEAVVAEVVVGLQPAEQRPE